MRDTTLRGCGNCVRENIHEVDNEKVAHICAEYLISSILLEKFDDELLNYLNLHERAKTLFYGLSWILGCKLKDFDDLIKTLRDCDVMLFPHVDDVEIQFQIDTVKKKVKEMYNCILENRKKEYEAYKRLVWNVVFSLSQALTRIIFFYITGDLKTAKDLADEKGKVYPKIPSELLKELADAIDEEMRAKSDCEKKAQERVKKSFIKLFYLIV